MLHDPAWIVPGAEPGEMHRGRYLVEALAHCGECHTPRDGFLVQYDTPDDLLAHPKDDFVKNFVGDDRALKRLRLVTAESVIQDFNKEVQKLVNREQDEEFIFEMVARAKELGFRSTNLDLIYGLPKQTKTSFAMLILLARSLIKVIGEMGLFNKMSR